LGLGKTRTTWRYSFERLAQMALGSRLLKYELSTRWSTYPGPARLQLFVPVMPRMADLPVLKVLSASHIVTDLTLAGFTPDYDDLRKAETH
jgi:acetoacetate decarboxylase